MKRLSVSWLFINIAGISLVGAVLWAWYTLDLASRDVERLRQEIHARGVPATLEELDGMYPPVAPEENAALAYLSAASKIRLLEFSRQEKVPVFDQDEEWLAPLGERLPPDAMALAREFLALNQVVIAEVREAQALEAARYPVSSFGFAHQDTAHLGKIRELVRLMRLSAVVFSEDGNANAAVADLISGVAIARSLSAEPMEISQGSRIGSLAGLSRTFTRVLSLHSLSADQLKEFLATIESAGEAETFLRAMRSSACQSLVAYSSAHGRGNLLSAPAERQRLEYVMRMLILAEGDLAESVESYEAHWRATSGRLDYILLSSLALLYRPFILEVINRDLLELVVAVEVFRLRTDQLPETLDDLSPDAINATDPYSGHPYHYLRRGSGYAVYSTGPNRADDLGMSGRVILEGDIVLNVAR